ncbi:MAG TPA: rRNA maturation RNase YbeY [Gammaproteobacteria bacterium]|jgi:probable rRNA maturation factor|nr:rRNA maturation RNase YbeY [Gammaproteobacteria bacterium]
MHKIFIQTVTDKTLSPTAAKLRQWAKAALTETPHASSLTLRLVDLSEIHAANREFRGKDKPTNVISFPCDDIEDENGLHYIGDILICPELMNAEAIAHRKTQEAYWAHLVIHSVLHLLGHDHESEPDFARMSAVETRLLSKLGYPNPYHSED